MNTGKNILCVLSLLWILAGLAGCASGIGPSLLPVSTDASTYSVTYNGNGATGGTVPADGNKYAAGATVTALGNWAFRASTRVWFRFRCRDCAARFPS